MHKTPFASAAKNGSQAAKRGNAHFSLPAPSPKKNRIHDQEQAASAVSDKDKVTAELPEIIEVLSSGSEGGSVLLTTPMMWPRSDSPASDDSDNEEANSFKYQKEKEKDDDIAKLHDEKLTKADVKSLNEALLKPQRCLGVELPVVEVFFRGITYSSDSQARQRQKQTPMIHATLLSQAAEALLAQKHNEPRPSEQTRSKHEGKAISEEYERQEVSREIARQVYQVDRTRLYPWYQLYVENYARFMRKNQAEKPFAFSQSPFVSFSETPLHSIFYGLGAKPASSRDHFPRYDREGNIKHPYIGKIIAGCFTHEELCSIFSLRTAELAAKQVIRFANPRLLYERERTFVGGVNRDHLVLEMQLRVPSLNRWREETHYNKYGLQKSIFESLQARLTQAYDHCLHHGHASADEFYTCTIKEAGSGKDSKNYTGFLRALAEALKEKYMERIYARLKRLVFERGKVILHREPTKTAYMSTALDQGVYKHAIEKRKKEGSRKAWKTRLDQLGETYLRKYRTRFLLDNHEIERKFLITPELVNEHNQIISLTQLPFRPGQTNRYLLTGEAGAGKTYAALCLLLEHYQNNFWKEVFDYVFYIDVSAITDETFPKRKNKYTIEDIILGLVLDIKPEKADYAVISKQFRQQILEQKRVLLLLDNMQRIPERSNYIDNAINRLLGEDRHEALEVAGIIGFHNPNKESISLPARMECYQFLDLKPEQIKMFVTRYFEARSDASDIHYKIFEELVSRGLLVIDFLKKIPNLEALCTFIVYSSTSEIGIADIYTIREELCRLLLLRLVAVELPGRLKDTRNPANHIKMALAQLAFDLTVNNKERWAYDSTQQEDAIYATASYLGFTHQSKLNGGTGEVSFASPIFYHYFLQEYLYKHIQTEAELALFLSQYNQLVFTERCFESWRLLFARLASQASLKGTQAPKLLLEKLLAADFMSPLSELRLLLAFSEQMLNVRQNFLSDNFYRWIERLIHSAVLGHLTPSQMRHQLLPIFKNHPKSLEKINMRHILYKAYTGKHSHLVLVRMMEELNCVPPNLFIRMGQGLDSEQADKVDQSIETMSELVNVSKAAVKNIFSALKNNTLSLANLHLPDVPASLSLMPMKYRDSVSAVQLYLVIIHFLKVGLPEQFIQYPEFSKHSFERKMAVLTTITSFQSYKNPAYTDRINHFLMNVFQASAEEIFIRLKAAEISLTYRKVKVCSQVTAFLQRVIFPFLESPDSLSAGEKNFLAQVMIFIARLEYLPYLQHQDQLILFCLNHEIEVPKAVKSVLPLLEKQDQYLSNLVDFKRLFLQKIYECCEQPRYQDHYGLFARAITEMAQLNKKFIFKIYEKESFPEKYRLAFLKQLRKQNLTNEECLSLKGKLLAYESNVTAENIEHATELSIVLALNGYADDNVVNFLANNPFESSQEKRYIAIKKLLFRPLRDSRYESCLSSLLCPWFIKKFSQTNTVIIQLGAEDRGMITLYLNDWIKRFELPTQKLQNILVALKHVSMRLQQPQPEFFTLAYPLESAAASGVSSPSSALVMARAWQHGEVSASASATPESD